MIKVTVTMSEIQPILDFLNNVPRAMQAGIPKAMEYLLKLAKQRTPVGKTGHLLQAWSNVEYQNGGWTFGNVSEYAEVVETGGYKGSKGKTVLHEGRYWSSQARGGMIKPILDNPEIMQQVEEMISQAFLQEVQRAVP